VAIGLEYSELSIFLYIQGHLRLQTHFAAGSTEYSEQISLPMDMGEAQQLRVKESNSLCSEVLNF
jgi:hypothetical protein